MPKIYYAGHARHRRLANPEVRAISTSDGIPVVPRRQTDITITPAALSIRPQQQDTHKTDRNESRISGKKYSNALSEGIWFELFALYALVSTSPGLGVFVGYAPGEIVD
jgi:hypothetical protein